MRNAKTNARLSSKGSAIVTFLFWTFVLLAVSGIIYEAVFRPK